MGRRTIREKTFLLLFGADLHAPEELPGQISLFFESEDAEYLEEEAQKAEEEGRKADEIMIPESLSANRDEIRERVIGVAGRIPELDAMLNDKIQGWDTGRIGKVELTILRLALYEMRFDPEVSDAVAINEAVELAKKYGQEKSGEFVNGVLAKFAKDRI
ncbi:MAG: transcription antitermination factor NusB [Lachnospiraceae bacterium]|nr:transcription antitermination factor NusB [Lachnospiraceae bacterium]